MKRYCTALLLCVIVFIAFVGANAENLLKNGDFSKGDSSWIFNLIGGEGKGGVVSGYYKIGDITNAGTNTFSLQLRQNGISVKKNEAYTFSFEAFSTGERTIEASIGMDGGPWTVYSDTAKAIKKLTATKTTFTETFIMNGADDANTRVQFNCGKSNLDVYIDNVVVEKKTDPFIRVTYPNGGEKLLAGTAVEIKWMNTGTLDKVKIEFSGDNGGTWTLAGDNIDNTGACTWTLPVKESAQCLVKVSNTSGSISDLSDGVFELLPHDPTDLIINGNFAQGTTAWTFDLIGGKAKGTVVNGEFKIDSIGDSSQHIYSIQLRQNKLLLEKGKAYAFSFEAYAAAAGRKIEVAVGKDACPYTFYTNATTALKTLTTSKQKFSETLYMEKADSGARVQFNCGLSTVPVCIDNVSLKKVDESKLIVLYPNGGEVVGIHTVCEIRWIAPESAGKFTVDFSTNNGVSWSPIATVESVIHKIQWKVPGVQGSKNCLVRVKSESGLSDVSDNAFEINSDPAELIINGKFEEGKKAWDLGNYSGAEAAGDVVNEVYTLDITKAGTLAWHVQFSQSGITLVKNGLYTFSFDAFADADRTIDVNIGMGGGSYKSYIDTLERIKNLTTTKQTFTYQFTMNDTDDVNARVEFNCGLSDANVYLDNISLKTNPIIPIINPIGHDSKEKHIPVLQNEGKVLFSGLLDFGVQKIEIIDVRGRTLYTIPVTSNSVVWNKETGQQTKIGHGAYILRFITKAGSIQKKIVLHK